MYGGAAGADQRGPTRVVILASDVDASFCAGADLKERKGFTPEQSVSHYPPIPDNLHETAIWGLGKMEIGKFANSFCL